jgi:hypothetical protein
MQERTNWPVHKLVVGTHGLWIFAYIRPSPLVSLPTAAHIASTLSGEFIWPSAACIIDSGGVILTTDVVALGHKTQDENLRQTNLDCGDWRCACFHTSKTFDFRSLPTIRSLRRLCKRPMNIVWRRARVWGPMQAYPCGAAIPSMGAGAAAAANQYVPTTTSPSPTVLYRPQQQCWPARLPPTPISRDARLTRHRRQLPALGSRLADIGFFFCRHGSLMRCHTLLAGSYWSSFWATHIDPRVRGLNI